jgi:hypothetical protein
MMNVEPQRREVTLRIELRLPRRAQGLPKELTISVHPYGSKGDARNSNNKSALPLAVSENATTCVVRFRMPARDSSSLHLLTSVSESRGSRKGAHEARYIGFANVDIAAGSSDLQLNVIIDNFQLYGLYQSAGSTGF